MPQSWLKPLWGQTAWEKVVLLDVDVVLLRNIDEMAAFPAGAVRLRGPAAFRARGAAGAAGGASTRNHVDGAGGASTW